MWKFEFQEKFKANIDDVLKCVSFSQVEDEQDSEESGEEEGETEGTESDLVRPAHRYFSPRLLFVPRSPSCPLLKPSL